MANADLIERLSQTERMLASTGREEDRQYETVQLGSELIERAADPVRRRLDVLRQANARKPFGAPRTALQKGAGK